MTVSLRPLDRWLEPLLAAAVIVAIIRAAIFAYTEGYLPQPFFYMPGDVWMDWFNTAQWAHNPGAYDTWSTVYPPLTFVLLKITSKGSCYAGAAPDFDPMFAARACDWVSVVTFHVVFVVNLVLIYLTFRRLDRTTAIPRFVAVGLGLPMLFGLERANPFLACFTCVLLAFGPLLKSARGRWLALALAINFKPYLIAALAPQLLKRRWRWFEGAALATIGVYLATYAAFGAGTPKEIVATLTAERIYDIASVLDLWFATTYGPVIGLLNSSSLPITSLISSHYIDLLLVILPALLRFTQLTIVLACAAAWLRPEAVPMFRLTGLGVSMAIISAETSGYSIVLLLLFALMEKREGFGRTYAIVMAYVLAIPADIPAGTVGSDVMYSFLSDRTVYVDYKFMLGPLVRPLLFMTLPFALSCVTLRQVWKDIRSQGWRQRWRFRNDLPLLIGEGAARRPA